MTAPRPGEGPDREARRAGVLPSEVDRVVPVGTMWRHLDNGAEWLTEYPPGLAAVRELCAQVEANPVGWGGPMVVSFARSVLALLPAPGAADELESLLARPESTPEAAAVYEDTLSRLRVLDALSGTTGAPAPGDGDTDLRGEDRLYAALLAHFHGPGYDHHPRGSDGDCQTCGESAEVAALAARPDADRPSARQALLDAAQAVEYVDANGLPPGVLSHPSSPHFAEWLRERAEALPRPDADRDLRAALGDEVADRWPPRLDRTEAIRQAEATHAALQEAHRVIESLREQVAAPDADRDALARVRALAERYAALAPEDDWGEDIATTVQADVGRDFLAALSRDTGDQQEV